MRFAHIADSHLGSWRQPELQELNLNSFQRAVDSCISENVEFILFTGDLFDTPFPSIEILKVAFYEFRKLKQAGIKCYIIAGSHDYSVSGKTFLDVLEKAGFCEICSYEDNGTDIVLKPSIYNSYRIYGYPGKKSGLEVNDLKRLKIVEPYSSHFRILMLHTTIKDVAGELPIDSININDLPKADYYALGHIHTDFHKEINDKPYVYGGPTFPNNFKELEELKSGCFYIIDVEGYTRIIKKEIKLKEIESVKIEIDNAFLGTEKIINELKTRDLYDKIVLLRVSGNLKNGKSSDIKFSEIHDFAKKQGAYSFLKNTYQLETEKPEINIKLETNDVKRIEDILIRKHKENNPSEFNKLVFPLMELLSSEKQESETNTNFELRLLSGLNEILDLEVF